VAAVDLQAVAVGVREKQEAPQARLIDIRAAYRRYAATFQFDWLTKILLARSERVLTVSEGRDTTVPAALAHI
jgi:hypothetical protein